MEYDIIHSFKPLKFLQIFNEHNAHKRRKEGEGWVSADFCYQRGTFDSAMVKSTLPNTEPTQVSISCIETPIPRKGGGKLENLYYKGPRLTDLND